MNAMQTHNKFNMPKLKLKINRNLILEIIQWSFFLLLIYSAGDKALNFAKFKLELSKSPIITDFSESVAYSLPAIETVVAILVIIRRTEIIGLYASFTVMVMFTAYIFVLLNYGGDIPCSCNGILEGASWSQHLIFNLVFVFLAGIGIFLHK